MEPSQLIIDSRADEDIFSRFTLAVDGTIGWGDGNSERDVYFFRTAPNTLSSDGRINVGVLTVGYNNHVKVGALNSFSGGQDSVVDGLCNVSWGKSSQITTEGECNFSFGAGYIQNAGEIRSNYSTVLGAGIITGSDHCFVVGGEATKSFGCAVFGSGEVVECENTVLVGEGLINGVSGSVVLSSPDQIVGAVVDNSLHAQMSGGYWFGGGPSGSGVFIDPHSSSISYAMSGRFRGDKKALKNFDKFEGNSRSFYECFGGKVKTRNGVELVDDRDEKAMLWTICKELREENKRIREEMDELKQRVKYIEDDLSIIA